VNDIGTAEATEEGQMAIGDRIIAGYRQVVTRVHAHGIPIFAATITPFGMREEDDGDNVDESLTAYSHPTRDRTRRRVNDWIRTSGLFDAVIDFDQVIRDNGDWGVLKREFDSGDRLHPNTEAFKALADAFPVDIFIEFSGF
jgi:lysophospholipase L1-like esterase